MTLREIITESILFQLDKKTLRGVYMINDPQELNDLSDEDLWDIFQSCTFNIEED
jgi:hypothetical protein